MRELTKLTNFNRIHVKISVKTCFVAANVDLFL